MAVGHHTDAVVLLLDVRCNQGGVDGGYWRLPRNTYGVSSGGRRAERYGNMPPMDDQDTHAAARHFSR
jgi:hypothetical protein